MRGRGAVTLLGVVLLAAPVLGGEANEPAAAAKGKITYARYCVACHGPNGKGDGTLAGDLRVQVPDLTGMAKRAGGEYPFERVVRVVTSGEIVRGHGSADMPAWGDVFKKTRGTGEDSSDAAVRNLSHYLGSIQEPAKQSPAPAK